MQDAHVAGNVWCLASTQFTLDEVFILVQVTLRSLKRAWLLES